MPKIYKWGSFSLAELRKVAKAYKEHTKVPAPSKMNKKDLIVLLDKHLLLDKDTAEIKVKATMESSLGAVERMPKKMKMPASPEKSPEPPAEKPKEMTTVEHIQALPKELQDLIFENLPKSQQRDLKEGSYGELIDLKMKKLKDFMKRVETEKDRLKKVYFTKGTNKKESEMIEKQKEKFLQELEKLDEEGRDTHGNIYVKQADAYFREKYGDKWFLFHPTAPNDKYFNANVKYIDLNYDAEKLVKGIQQYY